MKRRKAYIAAANEMVRPALIFWLQSHGFTASDMVFIHESRGVAIAYAAAMKQAIMDRVSMAVFCDNDALPSAGRTDVFFNENRYHLQCVKSDTGVEGSYDRHDAFHTMIWRASGESLMKIALKAKELGLPLCKIETSDAGDIGAGCACSSIKDLATKAGLTTGWIGVAGHAPRQKSLVPRICSYGDKSLKIYSGD